MLWLFSELEITSAVLLIHNYQHTEETETKIKQEQYRSGTEEVRFLYAWRMW
jgi:hypothetical protein